MTIKLYDLIGSDLTRPFSPHCWKTKMVLAHLKLYVQTVPTRFTEVRTTAGGALKTVPAIEVDGTLISDSFSIAQYFAAQSEKNHTALFGGARGEAQIRFIESWAQSQIHPWIGGWAMLDINNMQDPENQAFFRGSREKLVGRSLEAYVANREDTVDELVRRLLPMKLLLRHHDFLGGDQPNFADYIVFGAFQWLRICSSLDMLPADHSVLQWFERCLDLHDGLGRSVSAGKLSTIG